MLERVFTERSLQPPRDSMTSGTKDTPTAWQCEACIVIKRMVMYVERNLITLTSYFIEHSGCFYYGLLSV